MLDGTRRIYEGRQTTRDKKMVFVTDWKDCFEKVKAVLASKHPVFLGRLGGSDTNAVAALLKAREDGEDVRSAIQPHRSIVERFNGFYDLDLSEAKYLAYLETLIAECAQLGHSFLCNNQLLSMYFRENINPQFYTPDVPGRRGFELLIENLGGPGRETFCYPYPFVERLALHRFSLMHVLQDVLPGKKVLVVSPFAESIQANFGNRREFFRNFEYPEFTLEVFNTPITYSGLPLNFYPHQNWHETAEALKRGVAAIEFDIALMACGSYAMPLGNFIAHALGRKAVYIGGVLQMMFGVIGRRYENEFWLAQIQREKFIYPLEGERYLSHVQITPQMAREAFGAYF